LPATLIQNTCNYARKHALTHIHPQTYTCAGTHTQTHTRTHTLTCTHTYTYTCANTHPHTYRPYVLYSHKLTQVCKLLFPLRSAAGPEHVKSTTTLLVKEVKAASTQVCMCVYVYVCVRMCVCTGVCVCACTGLVGVSMCIPRSTITSYPHTQSHSNAGHRSTAARSLVLGSDWPPCRPIRRTSGVTSCRQQRMKEEENSSFYELRSVYLTCFMDY